MKVAVGHSDDPLTSSAVDEITEQITTKMSGLLPQAAMVFIAQHHDIALVARTVCDTFPGIQLIGCTTNGEVSSELRFQQDSIAIIAFHSTSLMFRSTMARNIDQNTYASVAAAVNDNILRPSPPSLCLTTPAALVVSASTVLDCLKKRLGNTFPIFGGIAGDDRKFKKTHQLCNREVVTSGVPLLFVYGPVEYSVAIASGWNVIGEPAIVTRSKGSVVCEINNQPAIAFYKKYLGNDLLLSPEYPLALLRDGFYELRAPLSKQKDNKSIAFGGDIPEGAQVQLTTATRHDILQASSHAIEQALISYKGERVDAALLFSCAARKYLLGTRTGQEYALLEDRIKGIEACGFYTYGEIGPHEPGTQTQFHNQTFIAVLLGDRTPP